MEAELKLSFPSDIELYATLDAEWFLSSISILDIKKEEYCNRYLDTKERDAHQHRLSLRIRHVLGQDYIHTVKCGATYSGGFSKRFEWNHHSMNSEFDAGAFLKETTEEEDPKEILSEALAPILGKKLEDVCATEFVRSTITAEFSGSVVEICLDTGKCVAGDKSTPICEMEIELVRGKEQAIEDLGKIVIENTDAYEQTISKYARCLMLLEKEE
ncbi:MAG: CYTH domain-containing protein [Clostridiales bacterium]|nr:CYTH domain-containing protein [Clostridiales bacterium]